jgi:hypothetical protein
VIAFLDRSDSEWWRADRDSNAEFLARLGLPLTLELDLQATPTDRLRIWRVRAAGPGGGGGAEGSAG